MCKLYYRDIEKSSGQYMITNEDLLSRIVESSGIRTSDTVLELGSGSGALTMRLIPISRKVVVCESDPVLSKETIKRVESEEYTNIELLRGGALSVAFPRFDVCVSNLPYSLSAPILFKLIRHRPLWRSSLLILQREFTDALIADPGERNYSRLSMNASVFVRSERIHRINGGCFYPVPPVESALVRLTPRNPPPIFDFDEFNELTRVAFIEKRKALKTVFSRPSVLASLELKYKEFCSFHRISTSPISFPKYLQEIIESVGLAEYPAKALPAEAMEALLLALHEKGIYFTSFANAPMPQPGESQATSRGTYNLSAFMRSPVEAVEPSIEEDIHLPVVS
jgi:18S rRNA (adenine1779-N6/adenine1780-N6)-dimethyltransferase